MRNIKTWTSMSWESEFAEHTHWFIQQNNTLCIILTDKASLGRDAYDILPTLHSYTGFTPNANNGVPHSLLLWRELTYILVSRGRRDWRRRIRGCNEEPKEENFICWDRNHNHRSREELRAEDRHAKHEVRFDTSILLKHSWMRSNTRMISTVLRLIRSDK